MGVEYKHFLIPADPLFVPSRQAIQRIDSMMGKWKLKAGEPKKYDLAKGINSVVSANLDSLDFGQGLAIEYPEITGTVVRSIMGASIYGKEIADEDHYIQNFTFIGGLDFRIHPSTEELCMTVIQPPSEGAVALTPYCDYDELLHYGLHAEAYTSTLTTTPPKVDIWAADSRRIIGGQPFSGFWRTAFVMDCGKNLPMLGQYLYRLENRPFVHEIEQALECRLIEIGEIY